ncbi:MAG: transketolase-like TK C-terminal-containing protein, partial [Acidaminococcaceae bacterium]
FTAYGWQVLRVEDAEDIDAITAAVKEAKADKKRPSLVIIRTHIGCGSPKQDCASAHGEPLGTEALAKTKEDGGWPLGNSFYVPESVKAYFAKKQPGCAEKQKEWQSLMADYAVVHPELASELESRIAGDTMVNLDSLEKVFADVSKTSTREASGEIIQKLAMQLPELAGGSADLGPSNKTDIKGGGFFSAEDRTGRNIHFGVREHAMGKIVNGMALHGGFIPYGGTFLVFSDFMRPALRMAALMGIRSVFVFTHDSIALGEDGPTHQPIEQTMSLRLIPELSVYRPADALETATAWQAACLNKNKPTALLLSRQKMPVLQKYKEEIHDGACFGAYVLNPGDASKESKAIILATGSEVHLALAAQEALAKESINVSVVSMPSWDVFENQSAEYKKKVLPAGVPKIAVEAGVTLGWSRYTGSEDNVIGINTFGASAPGDVIYEKYGFTIENVVNKVKEVL